MTLKFLTRSMKKYRNSIGGNVEAWRNFTQDMVETYDTHPITPEAAEIEVSKEKTVYWMAVARGVNSDYTPKTGARKGRRR